MPRRCAGVALGLAGTEKQRVEAIERAIRANAPAIPRAMPRMSRRFAQAARTALSSMSETDASTHRCDGRRRRHRARIAIPSGRDAEKLASVRTA